MMVERSFAMASGFWESSRRGRRYLPLPPDNPPDRTEYMLKDGGVSVLLVMARRRQNLVSGNDHHLMISRSIRAGRIPPTSTSGRSRVCDLHVRLDRPAQGSHDRTSGGLNRLNWMQRAYPIGEKDVILQKTLLFRRVGLGVVLVGIARRQALFSVAGRREKPAAHRRSNPDSRSQRHAFRALDAECFRGLSGWKERCLHREISIGAARIRQWRGARVEPCQEVQRRLGVKTGARLINLYGPTEATVDVSYFDCPTNNDFQIIPIGRPIDNIKLCVIQNGQQVGIGETGSCASPESASPGLFE